MLIGVLGDNLIENMLADKDKIPGKGVIRAGEGTIRAGQYF